MNKNFENRTKFGPFKAIFVFSHIARKSQSEASISNLEASHWYKIEEPIRSLHFTRKIKYLDDHFKEKSISNLEGSDWFKIEEPIRSLHFKFRGFGLALTQINMKLKVY